MGAVPAVAPEPVVYAGTASKRLAPGLGLGWLVLPAHLVDDVAAAKALADAHTGTLDQLVLAEFIGAGGYDRHVRRSRLAYRRRRDRLVAALRRRAPDGRVAGVAARLHGLLTLPAGQREDQVVARAPRRGLAPEARPPRPAPAWTAGMSASSTATAVPPVARAASRTGKSPSAFGTVSPNATVRASGHGDLSGPPASNASTIGAQPADWPATSRGRSPDTQPSSLSSRSAL